MIFQIVCFLKIDVKTSEDFFHEYFISIFRLISSNFICLLSLIIFNNAVSKFSEILGLTKCGRKKLNSDIAVFFEHKTGIFNAPASIGGIPKPSALEGKTKIVAAL